MAVALKPETERLVLEEIQNGHFSSLEQIIESGVRTRRFQASPINSRAEALPHMRSIRSRNVFPSGMTIREWIDEGRD